VSEIAASAVRYLERTLDKFPRGYGPAIDWRAKAKAWRKHSNGSRKLPGYVASEMKRDYERLGSIAEVAAEYGRTPTAIRKIFASHGVRRKPRGGSSHVMRKTQVATAARLAA
jgi:hypothetical protein